MPRSFLDSAVCPACDHAGLEYNAETIDLPYLGESLETMIRCAACGYRHTDFVITETKEPLRSSLVIETADDLDARVVRSSSGTIRIVELGIDIEPGVASDAFISNVEGILVRIEAILTQLARDPESDEVAANIAALQERFQQMRRGEAEPVTVMLEDPFGNSRIIHDRAIDEPIPADEAAKLKVGMFVFDQDSPASAA